MNAILRLDAETHGYNKEYEKEVELIKAVVEEIDENVIEVSIKKRAVKDNSPCIERPECY